MRGSGAKQLQVNMFCTVRLQNLKLGMMCRVFFKCNKYGTFMVLERSVLL